MTLTILENTSLQTLNTFGINVSARYLVIATEVTHIEHALRWAKERNIEIIILGGGSNVLFTHPIDGLVIIIKTQGIEVIEQQGTMTIVEAQAGVVWHQLVMWAVNQGLGGIENLSLIFGTVGAAPVQNIGAYGIEFKDVCHSVVALNRFTGKVCIFTSEACQFGYRDSFFKHHPNQWVILKVRIRLDYKAPIHIGYAALQQNLPEKTCELSYADISKLVVETRQQRLPNPAELGNAGSFFKNPIVSLEKAKQLQKDYPDLVMYPYDAKQVKLAAGWLIDKAGWKGCREGNVGTYAKQALVLVNYGQATGEDILVFSKKIQASIKERFGVELEPEPIIYQ